MTLFWEERVILMLDVQTLNRIDLSFEVIALISGVWRNSLLVPCGCFQGLSPPPRAFPFTQAIYFLFSLIHRGKHLPEGPLIIVPKYWFMFECMHADSSCLGTHSPASVGKAEVPPALPGTHDGTLRTALVYTSETQAALLYEWFTYTSCFSDPPPPYFPMLFRVAELPK